MINGACFDGVERMTEKGIESNPSKGVRYQRIILIIHQFEAIEWISRLKESGKHAEPGYCNTTLNYFEKRVYYNSSGVFYLSLDTNI